MGGLDIWKYWKMVLTRDQLISLFRMTARKRSVTLAGLEVGDTIFFIADKEERAAFTLDRSETNSVGSVLILSRRMHTVSVISMTSQCLRMTRDKEDHLLIIHSQCHRAV